MRTSSVSYPYPVVGNGNDVEGRFIINNFIRITDPDDYTFEYDFEITNNTVMQLINEKKAVFSMQVECSGTFQRFSISRHEKTGSFKIPTSLLREKVVIRFYVCATQELNEYLPEGSHTDYQGVSFFVEAGDIIANGGYTSFIAEKTFDPLKAPLDSLFRIKKGKFKGELRAEFDTDKITIILPESEHRFYQEALSRKLYDNIHAVIVYPVLVEALNLMQDKNSDYKNCTWFERINDICIQRAYSTESPLEAAQKILVNPVKRNFSQLNTEFSKLEENES